MSLASCVVERSEALGVHVHGFSAVPQQVNDTAVRQGKEKEGTHTHWLNARQQTVHETDDEEWKQKDEGVYSTQKKWEINDDESYLNCYRDDSRA